MKSFITFLLLGIYCTNYAFAQSVSIKLFRSIVFTNNKNRIDGVFYQLTDSTLRYVPNTKQQIQLLKLGKANVQEIALADIHRIVIRRKGHTGRAMLLGAGIGVVYGAILIPLLGRSQFQDNTSAPEFIASGAFAGIIYGSIISAIPRRVVRKNHASYRWKLELIRRFSYYHQKQFKAVP